MRQFFKVFIVAFICFSVVMTTGTYIFLSSSQGNGYNNDSNIATDPISHDEERINVLLVGVDAKDIESSKHARTDTIMLATFDPNTTKVDLISIPRDTRVMIRGRQHPDKINHAHAFGGIDLTLKAVKDFLGIPIHYYVKVNYAGVAQVIDDVGGVEVNVPMDMHYTDPKADPPLRINLKKGKQVLDSNKAMQFLRFRHGYANQDLGRINAQHDFLMALAKKLLSPASIIRLPRLINTFTQYVETNMPISKITSYAFKAKNIKPEDIHMVTLPGEAKRMNGIWYYMPDQEKTQQIIQNVFSEKEKDENTKKQ